MVTPLDFQGPMALLGFISPQGAPRDIFPNPPSFTISATYLGVTTEPVTCSAGPSLLPNRSYADVKEGEQFDIILVPGGTGTRPGVVPQAVVDFVKRQAPGAKYILSVCTGSEVLAAAGVLNGLRATTNKFAFKLICADYGDRNITWVPKARWVVDGRVWTSSGVTAGADMAYAFLKHLVGVEIAEPIRGIVELSVHDEGDDEFAEFYKLV